MRTWRIPKAEEIAGRRVRGEISNMRVRVLSIYQEPSRGLLQRLRSLHVLIYQVGDTYRVDSDIIIVEVSGGIDPGQIAMSKVSTVHKMSVWT